MPKDIRQGLEIIMFADMVTESEKQILTIEQFIRSRLAAGMTKEEIKSVLLRDLHEGGQLFGDFRKNIKATQLNTSENFARSPLIEGSSESQLMDWIGIGDNKICPDCTDRNNMQPRTFQEWASIGLPGEGATICNKNCRCVLLPVDSLDKGKGVIKIEG